MEHAENSSPRNFEHSLINENCTCTLKTNFVVKWNYNTIFYYLYKGVKSCESQFLMYSNKFTAKMSLNGMLFN